MYSGSTRSEYYIPPGKARNLILSVWIAGFWIAGPGDGTVIAGILAMPAVITPDIAYYLSV
jgi:hypothetical protein